MPSTQLGGEAEDLFRRPPRCAKLGQSGVMRRLAQLAAVRVPEEGMMEDGGRRRAPEQAGEPELAAGGGEEILAADHEVDPLFPIVDGDGELIGPLAMAVAHEEIAALCHRVLGLWAEPQIIELLGGPTGHHHP